jgi:DNA topoisomerase IB
VERIKALVLPPAWEDVWICPIAHGHVQATGIDAAGRRQYRYHDHWRVTRDLAKHERILDFAERLPAARAQLDEQMRARTMTRERVLATAVRLLDLGFFRVGSEQYATENGAAKASYGLATIRREHVTVSRSGVITFDYTAKSGKRRVQTLAHPGVTEVVRAMKLRRGGDEELLAWKDGSRWVDVKSTDINDHLRLVVGEDFSAKDFRTWNATVFAAVGLAMSRGATSESARKQAVTRVVKEVAGYLGNTPAVCRASYIDPRLIDLFHSGVTVRTDLSALGHDVDVGEPATHGTFEADVLALLREPASATALAG